MEFSWSEILLELLAVAVLFFGVHWSLRHAKTLTRRACCRSPTTRRWPAGSSGKPAGAAPAAAVPVAARATAGTGTELAGMTPASRFRALSSSAR